MMYGKSKYKLIFNNTDIIVHEDIILKYDKKTDTSIIEIVIHEGKNHQVKKMFEALGYDVLKLKRERISFLDVNNLKSGEYRILNPKEVKKLYNETTK